MPTSASTDPPDPTDGAPPELSARLHLIAATADGSGPQRTLDGAWWPGSRQLADEVPQLVAAFAERGVRVTRFVYNPSLWLIAPTKLRIAGRVVHMGWFREIDPNLVSLRDSQGGRIELLVIPPEASSDTATRAFEAATGVGNTTTPTDVLLAATAEPIAQT